ncbi:MAG: HAMP domain-containing histidine kinase, partial [Planctomycetes bacterium]|nr:HAMP domain-containing histidine kinase [Planctomycetota bacterium]
IAHEIKNPLAAMLTGVQLLSRSLDDKQRKIGDRLEREIHVLDRIVKDFLAFARGAAGKPEEITMGAVIARVRQQLTEPQENALKLDGDPKIELFIDSVALVQALANLIKNAAQAAIEAEHEDGRKPSVTLKHRVRGEDLILDIIDNGLGVTESVKGRLFSPFVSGRSEGTGLGLAIVRRFVEDMRGEVELLTSATSGTHFVLRVPLGRKDGSA